MCAWASKAPWYKKQVTLLPGFARNANLIIGLCLLVLACMYVANSTAAPYLPVAHCLHTCKHLHMHCSGVPEPQQGVLL
jgi:hypothetical protein